MLSLTAFMSDFRRLPPIVWPLLWFCVGLFFLSYAWRGIQSGAFWGSAPWGMGFGTTRKEEHPVQFWVTMIACLVLGGAMMVISLYGIVTGKY